MNKKAFTLIEVVIVIVILGVVATMGSSIIASMYQNYLKTQTITRLESQTQTVLEQVASRLSARVKRSTGVIRGAGGSATIHPLAFADSNDTNLTWIGISKESQFNGWNGFIDINNPLTNIATGKILSPGSHLNDANFTNTIKYLSYDDVSAKLSAGKQNIVLIMKAPYADTGVISRYYDTNASDYVTRVLTDATQQLFTIAPGDGVGDYTENGTRDLYEQYYLAYSAYAIVPEGSANDFNLTLKYNYQPWHGERFDDANTPSVVLAEHVSTFRFLQSQGAIRIKLCIHDDKLGFNFSACKETVVF